MKTRVRHLAACALAICAFTLTTAAAAAEATEPGFLAVAADRGFQGNEEVRDAFDAFAAGRNAELVFATDARTRGMLAESLARLKERGARRLVVLHAFLSAGDAKLGMVKTQLAELGAKASFARAFGESYLAVEALADRLRSIRDPRGVRLVVAGYGARDPDERRLLERDGQRIAEQAAAGFGFESVRALVWYDARAPQREERRAESRRGLAEAARGAARTVVVPFHLGRRLDSMMSYDAELGSALPAGAELIAQGPGPEAFLATWHG